MADCSTRMLLSALHVALERILNLSTNCLVLVSTRPESADSHQLCHCSWSFSISRMLPEWYIRSSNCSEMLFQPSRRGLQTIRNRRLLGHWKSRVELVSRADT